MIPALTPQGLIDVCKKLKKTGCIGCLISGGCSSDGSVPLGRFLEAISVIKRDLGLKIVVHTGLIKQDVAKRLKDTKIDTALIDIIGANETIKEIYHLDATVDDYEESLRVLHKHKIPLVPHVLIGLHYGKILGEIKALEMISKYKPVAVVMIVISSIKGIFLRNGISLKPEDITKIFIIARHMLPKTPLILGCMRPLGEHRVKTDMLAVQSGINAIAFPDEKAINFALSSGLKVSFSHLCCSQVYEDLY